ncbi:MAG: IPTL-CTERM sorting domain-containing protein, partial [Deltaproteobacteria bacterium]|nr:IPTL-CTERM sorting domain-containing protein [Deltaproteobacteria bacterium]
TRQGSSYDRTPGHGGAVHIDTLDNKITVKNNSMTLNRADNSYGGGLSVNLQGKLADDHWDRSGQLRAAGAAADILDNIIWGNSADQGGDDIYVDDLDDDDDTDLKGAVVNLHNNDFSDFYSLCENTTDCDDQISMMDNLDVDPQFMGECDLRLSSSSPLFGLNIGALINRPIPALSTLGLVFLALLMAYMPFRAIRKRKKD